MVWGGLASKIKCFIPAVFHATLFNMKQNLRSLSRIVIYDGRLEQSVDRFETSPRINQNMRKY